MDEPILGSVPIIVGLALALIALAAAAVGLTGRRERDRFITDLEQLRAEVLFDRGAYKSTR